MNVEQEKQFMKQVFAADGRNFHCWNYRRWLSSALTGRVGFKSDLEDTFYLIEKDFSNYSCFYHRYLCLNEMDAEKKELERLKELEFVKNCLQISPNDESLWTYFALICTQKELEFVREIIDTLDESDFRPYLYFAKLVI